MGHALAAWLDTQTGLRAEIAREELQEIGRLTDAAHGIARRIGDRVRLVAPTLLELPGCGELTARPAVGQKTFAVSIFPALTYHYSIARLSIWGSR